jgi:hypothetical protein
MSDDIEYLDSAALVLMLVGVIALGAVLYLCGVP